MGHETKNILINRIHDRALGQVMAKYVRGRLLDIGCGSKPYWKLASPYVEHHIGLDHLESAHGRCRVDIFSTAYQIPFCDQSFDAVLCTAVLEHLEEPEAALLEACRVLRGGGVAVYSVPFIWHLHEEPRDFFRYSKYGLSHLFTKSGFDIVELRALSGFWGTFGQLLVYNLYRAHRGPLRWLPVIPFLGLAVQGISFVLDRLDKTEQWTWMYMVVARKRNPAAGCGSIPHS